MSYPIHSLSFPKQKVFPPLNKPKYANMYTHACAKKRLTPSPRKTLFTLPSPISHFPRRPFLLNSELASLTSPSPSEWLSPAAPPQPKGPTRRMHPATRTEHAAEWVEAAHAVQVLAELGGFHIEGHEPGGRGLGSHETAG